MNALISRRFSTLILLAGLASASAACAAEPIYPGRSLDPVATVRLADLNPSTPEGIRVLYGRIRAAARSVCGPSFSLWNPNQFTAWQACYKETVAHTVAAINRPMLTAFHRVQAMNPPG